MKCLRESSARRSSIAARSASGLALVGALACGPPAAPPSAPSPALGQRASMHLPSDEGALVELPLASARVTVIDAFAPTCEPCREKVPALLEKRGAIAELGGELVLVAVLADGESTDDAAAALRSWGAQAPFLVDRGDVLRRQCGIDGLPATAVLDTTGTVRWLADPQMTADDIVAAVRAVSASP